MEDHDRSERHDEKSEKPPVKPIDNKVLAAMLRESASVVERGEFEPILYTALQDFRVYYKVHYPVKKNKHRSRSRSLTREKEKKSNKSFVAKEVSTGSEASGPTKPDVPNTFHESVQADTEHEPIDLESAEETMPVTRDVLSTILKHVDAEDPPSTSARQEVFEPEPKIEPHIPNVAGIVTAIPLTHSIASHPKPSEQHYSPGGTIQKASANVLFGKLKFPKKIGVTLPNPAFVTASKKNAERAKEDLEAFNGHLAQQAESSRRRKTGIEDGVTVKWCEVHFAMNCACKERTTSTKNVTHEPLSLSHSQPGERAQMSAGQRDEENQELMTQTAQPSPTSASTATNSTGATTIPATRATSAGDSPDASLSPAASETAAVAKEAHNNPFDTIQEGGGQTMTQPPVVPLKPDFQRPANANSSLIANGWIEQQRRSKMRFVWKEVLASLVQGRKPGEETTLWIQREIFNPVSQKKELEALHQIPVKLLESCAFLDYSTDNRFTLKLFNATEEFVFRCRTDSSAAKWVQVLKKHHEISRGGPTFEEEKKGPENSSSSSRMTVSELRAICHGAGINTAGMERTQLEAAAEEVRRRGTYFAPPPGAPRPIPIPPTTTPQQNPGPTSNAPHVPPEMSQASGAAKLSVSELRAICHGAGINTVGMERSQLERAAEEVRKRGTYFPPPNTHAPPPPSGSAVPPPPHVPPAGGTGHPPPPPPSSHVPPAPQANPAPDRLSVSELRAICHGAGINTVGMERQQLEKAAEEVRKRGTYFDRPSTNPPASTGHHPPSTSVPEEVHREAAEQNRQKMEEEQRRRMAEQEHQRRVAEQQAAEQHRRYAEQQAAWQKQQQEEEHRRRLAEQQAAEQRRRHEEAVRQQQQWQQQQWQKQQQQQWNQQYQQQQPPKQWPPNQAPPSQHPHWQQQQKQPPQQANHQQPQRPQPNQQQQQQQPHHSAASEKYAKMANQTDDEGQAMVTRIKHEILIHWALQPPQLQMLRPIDVLVTTIHKVFPPALGVPAHDYFSKFKPVSVADVSQNGTTDEEGLKKAVRKIRFFLHPDKLPKDLNPEQSFMVKMLWDVTSDAWDEFEKRKADLDWIK